MDDAPLKTTCYFQKGKTNYTRLWSKNNLQKAHNSNGGR
ncbi:hypothetical protein V6Z12_A01G123400 [Gossypium hirsutum]